MKSIQSLRKVDAVFEGGGVKGSALVGAIAATEEAGYQFENLAGTSAGAIVAALLAAGYNASELKAIIDEIDYLRFKDATFLSKIPVPFVGDALSLLFLKGIYAGDFFEAWLGDLLAKKGVRTFADLIIDEYKDDPKYRYKLQVIASDITNGKLLVLPNDAREYGVAPDEMSVAKAVRMSMSIPYFYRPAVMRDVRGKSYVVDGGVLSNFPVWLLDDNTTAPQWPTIGYKLVDPNEHKPNRIYGPLTLFSALISTMLEAHDARYIKDADFARTIPIPTLGVQTTDFALTRETKEALYQAGLTSGREFFAKWNFAEYVKAYRLTPELGRTDRIKDAMPKTNEILPLAPST